MSLLSGLARGSILAASVLAFAGAPGVRADDLVQESVPAKWLAPLLPEKLPALKHPDYFSDIDKAEAEAFTGRYKLSLITLAKIKDPKPDQLAAMALIKGRALAALGRYDEALAALTTPGDANGPATRPAQRRPACGQARHPTCRQRTVAPRGT